jgi:hypothetical protein
LESEEQQRLCGAMRISATQWISKELKSIAVAEKRQAMFSKAAAKRGTAWHGKGMAK